MTASSEISELAIPCDTPYQKTLDYTYGFCEAREKSAEVAHAHDRLSARMAGALAEINLEDPKVVEVLGLSATFNIGTALRMYREQQSR